MVPSIAAHRLCLCEAPQSTMVGDQRRSAVPTEETIVRLKNWISTVPTLAIIGSVLFLVLSVGGSLLLWGSGFAHHMVKTQLSEQQISFPPKGSPGLDPKEFPGLQRYAGQSVDSGPKA